VTGHHILAPTDIDDEVGLADWLEATMLVEQRAHMPRARIRRYIAALLADDDPDLTVDVVLQEVTRRQRTCQNAYPFVDDGTGVKYTKSQAALPYLFMLALSVSRPFRDQKRYAETDELFDMLVLDALKRYVGEGCSGVRFGAPASGDRPKNFRDAMLWLANLLHLPAGRGHARPTAGDGGLDVVVWRAFGDRRSGFLVVLAQCTVQLDWPWKTRDLLADVWRGWIDFGKDPHLVLAIPFVVPLGYDKWDELRRAVDTVVDRLRLCELLNAQALTEAASTGAWVASEVKNMRAS
jgi:hypothetical protein